VSWAALQKGAKKVWACDNYLPAVQSTQKLLAAHGEAAEALWDFTGGSLKPYKADFVLTNPPFHQEKRMNHRIGERWIRAAERLLRDDGSLILVANRFLDYPAYAADLFHDIQEIHGDKAFRVLRMIKRNTPPQGEDLDQWNAYLADQKNQARKAVEGN
jgi:16S rRNA (guanine1207-N2)-methyltransferase